MPNKFTFNFRFAEHSETECDELNCKNMFQHLAENDKKLSKIQFHTFMNAQLFSGSAQIEKITLSKMPINFGRIADSVNIKPANKFIYWTLLYHCNQMHITFICPRSYSINIVSKLIIPF